jgi:N-acetylglucosaminyl-diphospho-decaprenol L-rhamnosyltransferase
MIVGLSLWRLRILLTGAEDNTAPHQPADSICHGVFLKGFKLTNVQNPALRSTG